MSVEWVLVRNETVTASESEIEETAEQVTGNHLNRRNEQVLHKH